MKRRMVSKVIKSGLVASMMITTLLIGGCGSGNGTINVGESESESDGGAKKEEEKKDYFEEEVSLSAMIMQSQNRPGLQVVFDKLLKEHNIFVDAQVVPDDQYLNLLQMKAASGELPDLIEYNIPHIYNIIDPEEKLYDFSDEAWTEKMISPGITEYKGKQFGLPFNSNSGFQGMVYNKDVFEKYDLEVPTTVEEFDNVCKVLKDAGITPVLLCNELWVPQIWTTSGFSRAIGDDEKIQQMTDAILTGKASFNEYPELAAVIDELLSYNEKGYINKDMGAVSYDDLWVRMTDGEAAMLLGESGHIAQNKDAFPNANLGIFNVPASFDSKDILSAPFFTQGFVVNKDTENIDAIKVMFNELSTPEYANELYIEGHAGIPAFEGVEGGEIQEDIVELYEKHQKDGTILAEMNSYWGALEPLYNDYLWTYYSEALLKGEMDGEDILERFQKDVNKYMKENKVEGF